MCFGGTETILSVADEYSLAIGWGLTTPLKQILKVLPQPDVTGILVGVP